MHQMRARVITSPSFNGDRVIGTILFEGTMDRDIAGLPPRIIFGTRSVVCRS